MGTPRYPIEHNGKPCGTPGAVYESKFAGKRISLTVELPVYLRLSAKKETEMFNAIHNKLLLAIEDVYRDNWVQFAGQVVDDGGPLPKSYADLFRRWQGAQDK